MQVIQPRKDCVQDCGQLVHDGKAATGKDRYSAGGADVADPQRLVRLAVLQVNNNLKVLARLQRVRLPYPTRVRIRQITAGHSLPLNDATVDVLLGTTDVPRIVAEAEIDPVARADSLT